MTRRSRGRADSLGSFPRSLQAPSTLDRWGDGRRKHLCHRKDSGLSSTFIHPLDQTQSLHFNFTQNQPPDCSDWSQSCNKRFSVTEKSLSPPSKYLLFVTVASDNEILVVFLFVVYV